MSEAIFDLEQAVMNCWEIVEDLKKDWSPR